MNPTPCDDLRPRLSAYRDGALAPGRRRAIEAHLEGCAGCRGELESIARVAGHVAAAAAVARPGFEARLRARLETRRRTNEAWASRARLARRLSLVSAALLVVAVTGLGPALLRDWREARTEASDEEILQIALFIPNATGENGSSR
jgi:anti-sigma factor RsiW